MPPLIPLSTLENAAHCLKTVAHPLRLRMIEMAMAREVTVTELAKACELPQAQASGHLRILRDRGLMTDRREGRNVYYRVSEPGLAGILDCVRRRFGDDSSSTDS